MNPQRSEPATPQLYREVFTKNGVHMLLLALPSEEPTVIDFKEPFRWINYTLAYVTDEQETP